MPTISDPNNLDLSATLWEQPTFNQPTFNQPTFNQPTFHQPTLAKRPRDRVQQKKCGIIDQLPRGRCLEKVIRKQRKIQVPAVTGK
ncbi:MULTISPECIES: hypothetical protein [unclassified Moorena]|uniref:hypothetical protein n=1 Tax=unclassified Moorena TaxID=2683338 RepID=UPI001400D6E4|nr:MULTISPECIES: hypothetical protein [unclassified Moorena]NEO14913.1 hypothetical protein [Moorena sp. SIO3E8]NEQ02394.1 hypothetical protein [Moorena sp. SIO3F7]